MISLFTVLLVALSGLFFILYRKNIGQANCVIHAVQLQNALKAPLKKLLALNPRAQQLRLQKVRADANLAKAILTTFPPAIAAARALQTGVILAQLQLKAEQQRLLFEARRLRDDKFQELYAKNLEFRLGKPRAKSYYLRALAVYAQPANSITPDYKPTPNFQQLQQQRYRFDVNLAPAFVQKKFPNSYQQRTECSVTLARNGESWTVKILAGSQWLKSQSSYLF